MKRQTHVRITFLDKITSIYFSSSEKIRNIFKLLWDLTFQIKSKLKIEGELIINQPIEKRFQEKFLKGEASKFYSHQPDH